MGGLNLSFIENLLEETESDSQDHKYPIPEQHGPLRQFDKEMRCLSRRCGAPTYFKLQGVSLCYIHALRKMNDMLYERGVER